MNRPKHNRWLLTLFLVCAIILSLPLPKANAQNFVNNRFNVVVVLDASGSMKNTDPNGLRYEAIIARRTTNETQYDDSIVRQMIECIKVHGDGRLTIIFGGGYEIEETL